MQRTTDPRQRRRRHRKITAEARAVSRMARIILLGAISARLIMVMLDALANRIGSPGGEILIPIYIALMPIIGWQARGWWTAEAKPILTGTEEHHTHHQKGERIMTKLKDLPVSARVANRARPGIILRVGGRDLPGYPGTILVADGIVKQGCFDAKEPKNPDVGCRNYGNSDYEVSNAHQWLNSDGKKWFKPQHEYDASPTKANIFDGDNPYANDPGFLTDFSPAFKAALAKATIKTRKIEDGSIHEMLASVWLMSGAEVGFDAKRTDGNDEGEMFPLFADFRMRIAAPTAEAVETASYKPKSFNPHEGWWYWLRSPSAAYSYNVRNVGTSGAESNNNACNGISGLRPALLLKSDISVSDEPDASGVYWID